MAITAKPNCWVIIFSMDRKTLSEVMRYLGKKTSSAKAKAARKNGLKGGRPQKIKP
jgi:hypothetical protein